MGAKRPWYASKGYKHFDVQVGEPFAAKTKDPHFVSSHSWLPLIKYVKRIKRYRPKKAKTDYKKRPIMYASHRDACILKRYALDLVARLDNHYKESELSDTVIAYRKLGKANYHFSAGAYRFAQQNTPCVVLCFDITGFFDHLDHSILKRSLKRVLDVGELPSDWYAVFRAVTKYRYIELDNLKDHDVFGSVISKKGSVPIATIAEVIEAGIPIKKNSDAFGIPQGTPISSVFSNLYLLDFDRAVLAACSSHNALYQRYSDDILIICPVEAEAAIVTVVETALADHRLSLEPEKRDRKLFDRERSGAFQYLGFNISRDGAVIRPSSLSRQWRKAKRAIKCTKEKGMRAMASGEADKIFVSKLRRRFSPVGSRNFSAYSRRADKAFGSTKISHQVARLERKIDAEIRALQRIRPKPEV